MSCAEELIKGEMYRVRKSMEEILNRLTEDDNESYEWDIRVFYSFCFNERHEISDEYIIWVIYHENKEVKQQKFKFSFDSSTTIFLNRLCKIIYMYITKSYLTEGKTGNDDVELRYEKFPENNLTLEEICEVCTTVFAIPLEIKEVK